MEHSLEEYREFFKGDKLAEGLGFRLDDAHGGYAKASFTMGNQHKNAAGVLHGGVIFSLADFAFAVASNTHGQLSLGISANIFYLQAISSGTITAEATEVSRNPKLATYEVRITDQTNTLLATFTGMVYRKKELNEFGKTCEL